MIASPTKVEVEIYPDEYLALDVLIARLLFAALVRQADERGRS